MPNWCHNKLSVTGEPEQINAFIEDMKFVETDDSGKKKENALDFNSILPMPEHLKGTKSPSDDGSETWYDWQTKHWGVKWGACDSWIVEHEDNFVMYRFDTPWGPAIDWYETLIHRYPNLSFELEWEEGGMGFAGRMTGENGIPGNIDEWEIVWDEEEGDYITVE